MAKHKAKHEEQVDDQAATPQPISKYLDDMTCDAIGAALDALADGEELHVTAYYGQPGSEPEEAVFEDDAPDACLDAAREHVWHHRAHIAAYAIAYDGFVQDAEGAPAKDALLVEFGERGAPSAYTAAVLYKRDRDGNLTYSDPQPAGEESLLV